MLIEIHAIQNFAPSCLNRDDTGSPKDCIFGGSRRARISSQCFKRSIREYFNKFENFKENSGIRTKKIYDFILEGLKDLDKPQKQKEDVVKEIIESTLKFDKKDNILQYLVFFDKKELQYLISQIKNNFDKIVSKSKEIDIKKLFYECLENKSAIDIALFGRMIADVPEKTIEASCQFAHAISTHKVNIEDDFFTALDDLNTKSDPGAGMMGNIEFDSACFYRYANINFVKLLSNLKGNKELAINAIEMFLKSFVYSIPSAKQSTFAAQNLPSFVLITISENGSPWSLTNAFEKPVGSENGFIEQSIYALDNYFGKLVKMYGDKSTAKYWTSDKIQNLTSLEKQSDLNIDKIIEEVVKNIQ